MNATSIDIKDILEAYGESSGLDLDFASTLFIGKEPSKPDNCVTIFDTPGFPPYIGLTDVGYDYPSVQIRVRNKSYVIGMDLAQDIVDSLHARAQEVWNGTLYTVIRCSSGPALLDWDDNGNARIIINFNIQRRAV
jgi:hypothetical protein